MKGMSCVPLQNLLHHFEICGPRRKESHEVAWLLVMGSVVVSIVGGRRHRELQRFLSKAIVELGSFFRMKLQWQVHATSWKTSVKAQGLK